MSPLSQLRLRKHHVTTLEIISSEEIIDPDAPGDLDSTTRVTVGRNPSNHRDWRVALQVKFESLAGKSTLTRGNIEFVGYFDVDAQVSHNEIPKLVSVSGASLLYGAIREMVANVTARGPHKAVILPSVAFTNIALKAVDEARDKIDPTHTPRKGDKARSMIPKHDKT